MRRRASGDASETGSNSWETVFHPEKGSAATRDFWAGSAMFGVNGHYALKTAEHFDADYRILSQSGWGVYCSCYNDLIRVMPRYYEQICGVLKGEHNESLGAFEKNDFRKWQPEVVVVNLGSNDGFALVGESWTDPEDGRGTGSCPILTAAWKNRAPFVLKKR